MASTAEDKETGAAPAEGQNLSTDRFSEDRESGRDVDSVMDAKIEKIYQ